MQAAGMSQRALGQAIGVDPPTMSKALAGKRGFKPLELALISEALGQYPHEMACHGTI
jgi:transcriptional regulator with XRE-family HTH domain